MRAADLFKPDPTPTRIYDKTTRALSTMTVTGSVRPGQRGGNEESRRKDLGPA